MFSLTITKLSALILALTSIPSSLSVPIEPRSGCYKYIVIDSPGLSDATEPGGNAEYWTAPTGKGIVNALPGGYYYFTQSPHGRDPGAMVAADVALGELEIQTYMTATLATCPETKFVLFSYSFGSIAQGIALNNPSIPGYAISAIIYYGNFWWQPGKPQNRGTAKSGTSAGNGLFNTPLIYESITADYCLVGDYLCTGQQGSGSTYDAHHKYLNSQWQRDAINFAVNRLKEDGIVGTVASLLPSPVVSPVTSLLGSVPTSVIESPIESLVSTIEQDSTVKGLETTIFIDATKTLSTLAAQLTGTNAVGAATKTLSAVGKTISQDVASVTKSL